MMDRGYICLGKIITGSHTCKDSGVSLLLLSHVVSPQLASYKLDEQGAVA